jgi:hypothetical protein
MTSTVSGWAPSRIMGSGTPRSAGAWRIEFVDQIAEDGLDVWVVIVRVSAKEVYDFPLAIGRLAVIASGFVDHSETIPAIMHVREALDEIAGRLLGLVEPALANEIDGLLDSSVSSSSASMAAAQANLSASSVATSDSFREGGGEMAAASAVQATSGSRARQRRLYFLPLPPAGIIASGFGHCSLQRQGREPLYRTRRANARFQERLLAFGHDLATAARAAGCVRGGAVPPSARFRRKPRSGRAGLGEGFDQRLSFSCAVKLCSGRMTPPACRFLAKSISGCGGSDLGAASGGNRGAATLRTYGREPRDDCALAAWRRSAFTARPFWRQVAATFMPPVDTGPVGSLPARALRRPCRCPSHRVWQRRNVT